MPDSMTKLDTRLNILTPEAITELKAIMTEAGIDSNLITTVETKIDLLTTEKVDTIVQISKLVSKLMIRAIGKKYLSMNQLFLLIETNNSLLSMLTPKQQEMANKPTFTKHDYSRVEKLDQLDAIKVIKKAIEDIVGEFSPDREKLKNNGVLDIMLMVLSMEDQGYNTIFDPDYDFIQIVEKSDEIADIEVNCRVSDENIESVTQLVLTEPFKYLRQEFAKISKRNRG